MYIAMIAWILGTAAIGKDWALTDLSCVIFGVCTVFCYAFKYKCSRFRPQLTNFVSVLFLSLFSFNWAYLHANDALHQRMALRELTPKQAEVVVYVHSLNQIQPHRIQQPIVVLNHRKQPVQWLAYLSSKDQHPLELGQYYRLRGQILPAHSYAMEGVFDQEKWFLQRNLMSAFQVQAVQRLTEQQVELLGQQAFVKAQQRWYAQFFLAMEQQRLNLRNILHQAKLQNSGLLLALLTGDESLLTPDVEHLFQGLGLSHLLAISGPHVLIFALMLCWALHHVIVRFMPIWYLRVPKPYLLILPFCFGVFLYTALVGFEIPALRTLLSSILIALFVLFQLPLRPVQVLLLSAALLLYFDPFSILSAAFWLSYGSCLILFRIYQTLQQHPAQAVPSGYGQFKQKLALLFESQWKIFIALSPLMLIFFQKIVWIAPLSNLIALPWVSILVVPLSILAALCLWLCPAFGLLLFKLNDISLSGLISLLQMLELIFGSSVQNVAISWIGVLGLIVGLIILFLPRGVIPKTWGIVCFLPIFMLDQSQQPFELQILDVGQGQAIFVQQGDQQMMIDMGGNYDEDKFSVGRQLILPFLNHKGIKHLDQLILTHLDQDHSGGYMSLQSLLPIQSIYSNQQVQVPPTSQFNYCHTGQVWQWEGLKIEVLSPRPAQLSQVATNQNEYSCVVYIQVANAYPYANFLIMGDAGWETEYRLLKDYPNLKVDVLVLGHHGSKHSSAYDFLKRLNPKLTIASAGFNNRYGHPSLYTQRRLKALNIPLFSTANHGSVQFIQAKDGRMQLHLYREQLSWLRHVPAADGS